MNVVYQLSLKTAVTAMGKESPSLLIKTIADETTVGPVFVFTQVGVVLYNDMNCEINIVEDFSSLK